MRAYVKDVAEKGDEVPAADREPVAVDHGGVDQHYNLGDHDRDNADIGVDLNSGEHAYVHE
jgi:hypothetical protein